MHECDWQGNKGDVFSSRERFDFMLAPTYRMFQPILILLICSLIKVIISRLFFNKLLKRQLIFRL